MHITEWMGVDVINRPDRAGVEVPGEDFERFATQLLDLGRRLTERDEGWSRPRRHTQGSWARARFGGAFDWFRVRGRLEVPAEPLFELLADPRRSKEYDETDRGGEVVRTLGEAAWVWRAKVHLPLCKMREGLIFEARQSLGAGEALFVAKSVTLPSHPEARRYIRFDQKIWVCRVKPDGVDASTLCVVNGWDPGGRFPAWVLNLATPRALLKMFPTFQACVRADLRRARGNAGSSATL